MADKTDKSSKSTATTTKHVPKDAQVITSIMKEMGIHECEPKVINQLMEFTYRYTTGILEDARVYANHAKHKSIDVEDVRLALQMNLENTFTMPLPREVVLTTARVKNSIPLPLIKPHAGLRLPPDRYCLAMCNHKVKSMQAKKQQHKLFATSTGSIKVGQKTATGGSISGVYIKRTNTVQGSKTQTVTVPASRPPTAKITTNTVLKPKIQISQQNIQLAEQMETDEIGNSLKRKRDDEDEMNIN